MQSIVDVAMEAEAEAEVRAVEGRSRPAIGDTVTYRDSQGVDHPAFVTTVHGQDKTPAINVAFLSRDEKDHDGYGRAIRRATSVLHASQRSITGLCWRWPTEDMPPMPEPAPRQVRR